jgi:type VI secretion system secreted protein Hcp
MVSRTMVWLGSLVVVFGMLLGLQPAAAQNGEESTEIQVCLDAACFAAHSVGFGATQSTTAVPGGGGSAGKVALEEITFLRNPDQNSPQLFLMCASGQHIPGASIALSQQAAEVMRMELEGVVISQFRINADAASSPVEEVKLNYAKICISVPGDGNGTANETCWDARTNTGS